MKAVSDFAKLTGDFRGLSLTDMKVLALTHMFTIERGGAAQIRSKPSTVLKDQGKTPQGSKSGWRPTQDLKSKSTASAAWGGGWGGSGGNTRPAAVATRSAAGGGEERPTSLAGPTAEDGGAAAVAAPAQAATAPAGRPKPVINPVVAAAAWGGDWSTATPEGGGDDVGWITPANVDKVKSALGKANGLEAASVSVGCVTTDFAMQNVLLQMGLSVVSVDGMLVRRVKTFAFMCSACHRISHETHRQFCRACGQPTLFKITVKTNEDGAIQYLMPRFKKTNIRGTVYSMPTMKMGRVDNIILTEDQKELHRPRKKDKSLDVFSDEFITGDSPFKGTDKNVTAKKGIGMNIRNYGMQIGMGRRNPNASKRKTGNKKKK